VTIRRALGFVTSAALHVTAFATIVWMSSLEPNLHTERTKQRASVTVFVVPPTEPEGLPGLHPSDAAGDEQASVVNGGRTVLSIPHLAFDFQKIAERSTLLFPFLTPGLSLEGDHRAIVLARPARAGESERPRHVDVH
jgi:hypothetical protein